MDGIVTLVEGGQTYLILVPVFVALVGGERLAYALRSGRTWDDRDAAANLVITVAYLLTETLLGWLLPLTVLAFLYDHARLWTLGAGPGGWILAFLLYDLCWYVDHRIAHRVSLFWGFHQVHHSSNAYNMLVSSRGFVFDPTLLTRPSFLLLGILGVSPMHYVVVKIATNVWGIVQHTRLVGKLGPIDAVLATPSNHRVHHGSDPKYLDKNFGEVLIVWDRLFGTYQREEEEPTYGLTVPEHSNNPLWIEVAGLAWLLARLRRAQGLAAKVRATFGPPELRVHEDQALAVSTGERPPAGACSS